MLGIVIEDVPSVRDSLKKMLQEAGCEKVETLGNTKKLIGLLKKASGDRQVIVVSDLMDSNEAGRQRYTRSVLGVAEKRVKELVEAQAAAPAAKIIVYSLAPTLLAASLGSNSKDSKYFEEFVRRVEKQLKLGSEDFVGKLGPEENTFGGSQGIVAERVRELIGAGKGK